MPGESVRPPVFIAERSSLELDAVTLDGPEGHHAAAVRRLQAEGVGLVFAAREIMAELEGLLELPIVGLAPEDAR